MELKATYWHHHLDVRIFRILCTDGDGNCIVDQFIGPCMGRMLLGDDSTSLGDDLIIAA